MSQIHSFTISLKMNYHVKLVSGGSIRFFEIIFNLDEIRNNDSSLN